MAECCLLCVYLCFVRVKVAINLYLFIRDKLLEACFRESVLIVRNPCPCLKVVMSFLLSSNTNLLGLIGNQSLAWKTQD